VLRLFADQAAVGIENARLYDQVQRLAVTDPLTGCYNRRGFTQIANAELARASRFDHSVSMLMIDIDHFKLVNDAHGHAMGDRVLVALVDCCRRSLRAVDIIGRHGGEEFVVLLPETDSNLASMIAERLRVAVKNVIISVDGKDIHVSISVGVASMDPRTSNLDLLIAHADQAQYRAKQAGRNSVVVYTE
jgi:diguanylate cyclase (GGDEF)-like protein